MELEQRVKRTSGWLAASLVLAGLWSPVSARAGGIEYVAQGTTAMGRGGAVAVGTKDGMALSYNPAALADLSDGQIMLNLNNAFHHGCVERDGAYGEAFDARGEPIDSFWGQPDRFSDAGDYRGEAFPVECQQNKLNPGAWLTYATPLGEDFGIGAGVITPAAAGHLIWGDGDGNTEDGTRPSPLRYMVIEQKGLILHPTVGLGWRISPQLSLGLSLQWGVALVDFVNHSVTNPTENPGEDTYSEVHATDFFVPAGVFALQYTPLAGLELALFGRYSDAILADGNGEVHAETAPYSDGTLGIGDNSQVTMEIPQPAHAGLGIKYSQPGWDVELDAVYIFTSQFDVISVDIPDLAPVFEYHVAFDLPHYWRDQVSLRVGGDYQLIRDILTVRAGAHYETSAVDGSYLAIDFQPAQRLGLHGGLTYRMGALDLLLAYGHIFQETIEVARANAAFPQVSATASRTPQPADPPPLPAVVNAGRYETGYDIVSLGINYHL